MIYFESCAADSHKTIEHGDQAIIVSKASATSAARPATEAQATPARGKQEPAQDVRAVAAARRGVQLLAAVLRAAAGDLWPVREGGEGGRGGGRRGEGEKGQVREQRMHRFARFD